jgi:hypothetical protein
MRLFITAKPGSKEAKIEQIDDTHFVVAVRERPVAGKANVAIVKALAEYFGQAPSLVRIVAGHTSRQKIVEVG